jgi:hypothetical protein
VSDQVHIGEVVTDLIVTESVGPLSPEDVKRLAALVAEHMRQEKERTDQRTRDVEIRDRAFRDA